MDTNKQIFARLKDSQNLPSLPQVLLQLIETCDKEDMHLSDIARILEKDPSISSRALALVNSSYFGLNGTFSLDQAVVYLGADTIKNIAITVSVQQVFSKLEKSKQISLSRFWWNSFASATYAKKIAKHVSYTNAEEAYLAGLLHDLGELLLWINFPEECEAIKNIVSSKSAQCKAEEEQIGINHCEAGAWLMKQWKLNSFITNTVLYHHSPLDQIKSAFPLVKIVYLAENFSQHRGDDLTAIYEIGNELFELSPEQVDEIHTGTEDDINEVAQSLGIKIQAPSEENEEPESDSTEHDLNLTRQIKNYSLLHGFLENLVQAENRDGIFNAIEQALNVLFGVETIFFFLHDLKQQKLYGNGSSNNQYTEQLRNLVVSVEPGTSLLVTSMLENQLISSIKDEELKLNNLADAQLLDAAGGKGILYIPMLAKKKAVGVIAIAFPDSPDNDLSSKSDQDLLKLLANQAAISLYLDDVKSKQAEEIQTARLNTASMAAAKVVHEVNNPLGIIKNYLKILAMKLPEKNSLTNELTILDEEINRISAIIKQLNDFSTSSQNKIELTDINNLFSNLLSILSKSVYYSANLKVHFTPDPDLPAIMTDGSALKQIIINLIKNAAEAMTDGGNVFIKAIPKYNDEFKTHHGNTVIGDFIELTIKDDGPGIPEKVLSRLFEPFTSTKGKGHSGLGLSIISTLVTEMQGVVECTSDKNNGTLFTIALPIKK